MFKITQPPLIIFGKHSVRDYSFPQNCLVVTSKGAISRGWLEYLKLNNYHMFDKVEPNPSIETAEGIISEFRNSNYSNITFNDDDGVYLTGNNFSNIKNNLAFAKAELEDLQNKVLLKSALIGTSLANNLAYEKITKAQ